ncbi:unnamed protein product [Fraxinus pennsylvanica]|uniref:Protein XRI1 n=1 Tax=Fraxinus pennsylvanica TaxID=56036 RepID=A0AAD1ZF92_9LAMI|nr:unnamed protein product [Fraxinus pennsylvanica]
MSDLHSIAYSSHSSSLAWELQNLGVFNADTSQLMMMENTPTFFSPLEADYSTGYLQDALFEFSSKRRRLLLFDEDQTKEFNNSIENCRNSNFVQNSYQSYDAFGQISMSRSSSELCQPTSDKQTLFSSGASGEKRSKKRVIEDKVVYPFDFVKPGGFEGDVTLDDINERILMPPSRPVRHPVGDFACRPLVSSADGPGLSGKAVQTSSISSLNTQPTSDKQTLFSSGASGEKRSKKRVIEDKVVYPFDFVKPGGFEGDVTLDDINERILMPPSRPVRHPVGDFACRPLVSSADGPGLSGKAVVALTRIHTQGRGTITIIRTRG